MGRKEWPRNRKEETGSGERDTEGGEAETRR
jgi:hypothetical protein